MTTVTEVRRRRVAKRPPALPTIALSLLLLIGAALLSTFTGAVRLPAVDVAREFGLLPLPYPAVIAEAAATLAARIRLPFVPPAVEWVEAASHPAIMDTAKAKEQLGWRPRFTGIEALQDTLRGRHRS